MSCVYRVTTEEKRTKHKLYSIPLDDAEKERKEKKSGGCWLARRMDGKEISLFKTR
jgi:hypothetical protein